MARAGQAPPLGVNTSPINHHGAGFHLLARTPLGARVHTARRSAHPLGTNPSRYLPPRNPAKTQWGQGPRGIGLYGVGTEGARYLVVGFCPRTARTARRAFPMAWALRGVGAALCCWRGMLDPNPRTRTRPTHTRHSTLGATPEGT